MAEAVAEIHVFASCPLLVPQARVSGKPDSTFRIMLQTNNSAAGPHSTGSTLPEAAERMIASVAATPWIA
jgi:hypothetical protein